MDLVKFKELLDQQHKWPCKYLFKFVVLEGQLEDIISLIPGGEIIGQKKSKNGKYISVTISKKVGSSREVLEFYERAESIDGIISL